MHTRILLSTTAIAAALFAAAATSAVAQSAAEFYKGKQVTLVIPAGTGGSYGLYGQIGKAALEKAIPGVTVVPQYMPGAGGAKAANYIASAAPRDGSMINNLFGTAAQTQLFKPKSIHYDARKIPFIGQYSPVPAIISVRSDAPATSIKAIMKTEIALGSSGAGSQQTQIPVLLNKLLGTKFKVIQGYKGSRGIFHAIENGEVHGALASNVSWLNIKPGWVEKKYVIPVLQFARKRAPGFDNVPTPEDITNDKEILQILHAADTGSIMGRSLAGVPGMPKDRLQYLRDAFRKGIQDPAVLALAKKLNLPIDYTSGEELDRLTLEILATPQSVVDKVKKLLNIKS
jgi:tripartite-type tricarboxylate transporter receptor subunit TctC